MSVNEILKFLKEIYDEVRDNIFRGNGDFVTIQVDDIKLHDMIKYLESRAP